MLLESAMMYPILFILEFPWVNFYKAGVHLLYLVKYLSNNKSYGFSISSCRALLKAYFILLWNITLKMKTEEICSVFPTYKQTTLEKLQGLCYNIAEVFSQRDQLSFIVLNVAPSTLWKQDLLCCTAGCGKPLVGASETLFCPRLPRLSFPT